MAGGGKTQGLRKAPSPQFLPCLSFHWAPLTKHKLKDKIIENFKMAAKDHYASSAGALRAQIPSDCTGHTPRTLALEAGEYVAFSAVTAVPSGKEQPGHQEGAEERGGTGLLGKTWVALGTIPKTGWGGLRPPPSLLPC